MAGSAGHAGDAEAVVAQYTDGAVDAGAAPVGGVIARCRAAIEPGGGDGADHLGRHAVQRGGGIALADGGDGRLQVAHSDVGAVHEGANPASMGVKSNPRPGAASGWAAA